MAQGLFDFGAGALSGAGAGASIGKALAPKGAAVSPWLIGGAAALGGLSQLIGGRSQSRLENKINRQSLALGEQQLQLGGLEIRKIQRAERDQREKDRIRKRFAELMRGG